VGLTQNRKKFALKKLPPKDQIPLNDFYKIRRGEGIPALHIYAKFHHCGFKNVGLKSPKWPKLLIFNINFP